MSSPSGKEILEIFSQARTIARIVFHGNVKYVGLDDLVSCGVIAAFEAWKRFDPSKGVKRRTFLGHRMKGAMLDELRKADPYSRTMRTKIKKFQLIEGQGGGDVNHKTICHLMKVTSSELSDIKTAGSFTEYQIEKHGDTLEDVGSSCPVKNLDASELREKIEEAIGTLGGKAGQVIRLRFLEDLKQQEVGEILAISSARVSQIEKEAKEQLKDVLDEYQKVA